MPIRMPEPDSSVIARRGAIVRALREIVPGEGVIEKPAEMHVYESDALTAYRQPPMVVVLPDATDQVARILQYCQNHGVKVVPRGSGTSLSGGALPLADGVLLGLSKFKRIREIDLDNRAVVVEPGVTNLAISQAVAHAGFFYAPDPSSQIACSIGGNIAENSGGVHCLKYGLTTNNVLGCEIVLMSGEILRIGGKAPEGCGYDLLGVITGSEGLLGVVTEVTVRILRKPETARALIIGFGKVESAGECVARIIGAGIIPAGLEMMDKPAILAVEAFVHAGYPVDAEALLIIELDGPKVEVDELVERVYAIARNSGCDTCQISSSEAERNLFWAGRKAAFPAVGRISPDYLCMDGTIPRKALPTALARIRGLSETYGLGVANVFHAGDGNLHPLILYDANKVDEIERAEAFGADILRCCVELGGVLSGEHGIGVEKRDLMPEMFSEADLDQQQRLKCAFDPNGLLNPGKVFPTLHRCAELGRTHVHRGKLRFPDIPRF
jgi:glycolate oxidase